MNITVISSLVFFKLKYELDAEKSIVFRGIFCEIVDSCFSSNAQAKYARQRMRVPILVRVCVWFGFATRISSRH